jgi:hypothetical protein
MQQTKLSQTSNSTASIANSAYEIASFMLKRIPNVAELANNVLTQSVVDTLLGRVKLAFGNNPTASAIIRDAFKLPSVLSNALSNNKIGGTETAYEMATVYAATMKVVCKSAVIGSYGVYSSLKSYNKQTFEAVSRGANYICEIPNRFLNIASREKQIFERKSPEAGKINFFDFIKSNSTNSWYAEATIEGFMKTVTSDQLGELAKKIGYMDYFRNFANNINNVNMKSWFNLETDLFTVNDDIYSKASKVFTTAKGLTGKALTSVVSISSYDFGAKMVVEVINCLGLSTAVRTVQDSTGKITREAVSYVNSYLTSDKDLPQECNIITDETAQEADTQDLYSDVSIVTQQEEKADYNSTITDEL